MGYMGLALGSSIGITVYAVTLWIFLSFHIKKYCPTLSFSNFYLFCGLWVGVIVVCKFLSGLIVQLGIYQQTQLSAAGDVLLAMLVSIAIGWGALRTVFKRYTGTPLF